jgi:GxxExxY protein
VIGAAIEVHRHLGPGLLETVYERALVVELGLRGIPIRRQVVVPIRYKGHSVGDPCIDLVVADELVVELKAVEHLSELHRAQVISYLKVAGLHLGLLINFNATLLKTGIRRVVLSSP